jgi:hypothetical protein
LTTVTVAGQQQGRASVIPPKNNAPPKAAAPAAAKASPPPNTFPSAPGPWSSASMISSEGRILPSSLTVWMKGRLVSESYAEVVLALVKAGVIGLVPTTDEKGTTLTGALEDRQALVGGAVAPPLETFLCERNGHVCSSERDAEGKRSFNWRTTRQPLDRPISLLSCDARLPNSVLCLPDLKVERNDSSIGVRYDGRADNLSEIVKATGGCWTLDAECRRWTMGLNRQTDVDFKKFTSTFDGTLVVPAKQYRLELSVGSAEQLDRIVRALDEVIAALRKRYGWEESQRFVYYTVQRPVTAQGALALPDALGQPPLSLMKYPYQDRAAFDAANFLPTVVGVWDRHLDDAHCSYASGADKAILLAQPLKDVGSGDDVRFNRVPCFQDRKQGFSLKWDHATHVAGLIAGRGGAEILGANPKALIWSYEVSEERLQGEDPIVQLARGPNRMPDVINISMAETGIVGTSSSMLQSRLEALVRGQSSQNLFVIAAGNAPPGGQPLQFDIGLPCRIMPACISVEPRDGRGVVSVVALDSDGVRLLTGDNASNFGTAFDVAAVGVAQSSFDGNFRGRMRGTSVATPFVSALASLLYSKKGSRTQPSAVKDRILLTADLSDDFDEIVRFGKINFSRALANLDSFTLVAANSLCDPNCTPNMGTVRADPADQIEIQQGTIEGIPITQPKPIKVANLMRLSRPDGKSPFYVVYRDETGVLRKVRGATFNNSQVLQFKKTGENRFNGTLVNDLKEYVCSFAHNSPPR